MIIQIIKDITSVIHFNPQPGFFTVSEEIPGLLHTEDMTSAVVDQSYWASYSIPYFDDVSEESGNAAYCQRNSEKCFQTCPRVNLFPEYHLRVS